jgi:squalene synthase HpnC
MTDRSVLYLTAISLSNHGEPMAMDNAVVGSAHYENFPVASVLCPRRLREPIRCIYAFARTADDIADEGAAGADERLAALRGYRNALRHSASSKRAPSGETVPNDAWPSVFTPLASAIDEFALPLPLLEALLDAFEQDARNPPYENREQLLDYCQRSAMPVGRLLLHLYGIDDSQALREADAICSSLQLINFWQDLSVDLPRGRVYLPRSDCRRFGVSAAELADGQGGAAAAELVRELVLWAADLMASGAGLPRRIPGRAGWELRVVMHGGWRILERIRQMDFRSYARRPRLTSRDVPLLLWRAMRFSPDQFRPEAVQ